MDSKNRIIIWMSEIRGYLTEAFLINLSNKGIYNRATKDLEKCKEQLKLSLTEDDRLQVVFEEGITVKISKKLQENECSCPAQMMCRHIMTALLYCKAYDTSQDDTSQDEAGSPGEETEESKEMTTYTKELPELIALTKEEIIERFGKKLYHAALTKLHYLHEITFEYDLLITVSLESESKVYFPRQDTLAQAVCSCKQKDLCMHKLLALLAYLQQEYQQNFTRAEEDFKLEAEEIDCLQTIQKEIGLILDKGLCGLTEGSIKKVEKLYMKAYGRKLYLLANELKSLSGELNYYFSKNVAFSNKRMLNLVCRINNRIEALHFQQNDPEKIALLVGTLREEAVELKKMNLIGLGARCTLSKRQDLVLTAYFYCIQLQKILTLSTLRAMEMAYSNTIRRGSSQIEQFVSYLYSMNGIWAEEFSFENLLGAQVIAEHSVITEEKLSATKKTHGKIVGRTTLKEIKPLAITAYDTLRERLVAQDYFRPYRFNKNIYLIEAKYISSMVFNQVEQKLQFTAEDEKRQSILFYLPYNSVTEKAIRYLEKEGENIGTHFLGNVTWKKDHLEAELLSVFKEGCVKNIFIS